MTINSIPKEFNPPITSPSYILRNKLLRSIQIYSSRLQGKLLDFGCGSKPYQSLFKVDSYTGVDFNGDGHSHENEQIDFFYDGKTLPFDDNQFDSVFSTEVFEHVFNLEEILPEIRRVMKPGGLILVTCPFAIAEHEQPNDYARYTSFALKYLFENNGFEIIEYKKIGNEFETIMQLLVIYVNMRILCKFNKLKIVRPVLDPVIISLMNLFTITIGRIIPSKQDLYMNNLILCKKKTE